MTAFKTIFTTLPHSGSFFPPGGARSLHKRRLTCISCCAKDTGSPAPQGDAKRQELLAKIAMLQTEKFRLTNFLDETSEKVTQFAEDANVGRETIAENTLKELDEATERIMADLDEKMQAFKETADLNQQEIEENEKVLKEFVNQMEKDKNEGLFFKSLTTKAQEKVTGEKAAEIKEEVQKLQEVTNKSTKSNVRRNIYLALLSLLTLALVDAVTSASELDVRKVVVLGVILLAVITQFVYEQSLSSKPKHERLSGTPDGWPRYQDPKSTWHDRPLPNS